MQALLMSKERDSKLEKSAIPMFIIGLVSTTLGMASWAETVIVWRDFFREGVLDHYREVRSLITNTVPIDAGAAEAIFNYLMLLGLFNGWRAICRHLLDNPVDLPFGLGDPEPGFSKWVDRIVAPLIFMVAAPMILLVGFFSLFSKEPILTRADWNILGLWLVPFIPLIGLIFFASDLIQSW